MLNNHNKKQFLILATQSNQNQMRRFHQIMMVNLNNENNRFAFDMKDQDSKEHLLRYETWKQIVMLLRKKKVRKLRVNKSPYFHTCKTESIWSLHRIMRMTMLIVHLKVVLHKIKRLYGKIRLENFNFQNFLTKIYNISPKIMIIPKLKIRLSHTRILIVPKHSYPQ